MCGFSFPLGKHIATMFPHTWTFKYPWVILLPSWTLLWTQKDKWPHCANNKRCSPHLLSGHVYLKEFAINHEVMAAENLPEVTLPSSNCSHLDLISITNDGFCWVGCVYRRIIKEYQHPRLGSCTDRLLPHLLQCWVFLRSHCKGLSLTLFFLSCCCSVDGEGLEMLDSPPKRLEWPVSDLRKPIFISSWVWNVYLPNSLWPTQMRPGIYSTGTMTYIKWLINYRIFEFLTFLFLDPEICPGR